MGRPDDSSSLSYETLREQNIARNKKKLSELGVQNFTASNGTKSMEGRRPSKRPRRTVAAPAAPTRRSVRVANGPAQDLKGLEDDGSESDFEPSSDSEGEDGPVQRRAPPRQRGLTATDIPSPVPLPASGMFPVIKSDLEAGEKAPVVSVERAKTGRSSCRKCRTQIGKGEWRAGIESWIVGRKAMTWQCPGCALANLAVAVEQTGRGKCKSQGVPLPKGSVKLGVRSHTATHWITLAAVPHVLSPLLAVVDADAQQLPPDSVEGFEQLGEDDAKELTAALDQAVAKVTSPDSGTGVDTDPAAADTVKEQDEEEKQEEKQVLAKPIPTKPSGRVGSGRVAWKFGRSVCYGDLLPQRENKTHCFARTHKGNIKTLTKGKASWSVIDAK